MAKLNMRVEAGSRWKHRLGGLVFMVVASCVCLQVNGQADPQTYLSSIKESLKKEWPANRTINLVFHGHSVPSGYFRTPDVRTLDAYPQQVLKALKGIYPTAVINVIVTAIGGENSEQGEKRFSEDVLIYKPDVLFIDYALNDRKLGLARAEKATVKMVKKALKRKIKVILLTPSPDVRVSLTTPGNELELFATQIGAIAGKYEIGLADSYGEFKAIAVRGEDLNTYMSQSNHPDEDGHLVIAGEILNFFK